MGNQNPFTKSMVKLSVPAHMGSNLSVAGFNLDTDDDGCVEVPREHVDVLKAHGLTEYQPPEQKAAVKAK